MKKFVAVIVTVLMLASLCTFLTGCSASYEGTYVLESVTKIDGAVTKKYVVGETYGGATLKQEATILKVKKDKTWYLEIQMPELNMSDISTGTWKVVDGNLILTDEVKETIKVTQENGKLTFDNGANAISTKFVLKKSNDNFNEKAYSDLYLGKYNFESADITVNGGEPMSIQAGQVLQLTVTVANVPVVISIPFTADTFQLEIKADNTCTMTTKFGDLVETESGTWKLEGKKLVITSTKTQEVDELIRVNGKIFTSDTQTQDGVEMKMDMVLKPANN